MENLQSEGPEGSQSGGPEGDSEADNLGRLLRQSRQQALRENLDETPITLKMLDDIKNRQFWRLMQAARKRVRGRLGEQKKSVQES